MQCSRTEFSRIIAFMECATGAPATPKERVEVYYTMLADYPASVIETAVKQVVLLHQYQNLPPVGAIRSMILDLQRPPVAGHEAWEMFVAAMRKHGCGKRTVHRAGFEPKEIDNERNGLESLPPRVRQAARAFGWRTLCETTVSDMGIARTQFLKLYDSLIETEQHRAIMPPEVKSQAAAIAESFAVPETKQLAEWVKRSPAIESGNPEPRPEPTTSRIHRGPAELAEWIKEQELKKVTLNGNEQLLLDGEVIDLPFAELDDADMGQGDA